MQFRYQRSIFDGAPNENNDVIFIFSSSSFSQLNVDNTIIFHQCGLLIAMPCTALEIFKAIHKMCFIFVLFVALSNEKKKLHDDDTNGAANL